MSDLGNKQVMAENIRYYLRKNNLSQSDICNALGFTTKDKQHNQFVITKEYLLDFIKANEELSDKLHTFRGY